jgi:3-isopropylmalate/(R)-2-methylmalate dehydratase small subunit
MEPIHVIEGGVTVIDRADVDTDQIMPKQSLKLPGRTGFVQFLFLDWLRSGEITLEKNPILASGRNFGCGSSREHAVWGIAEYGFKAVVAPSFGEIFYNNCTKNGVLPVILPEPDVQALMAAGEATIDLDAQTVVFAGRSVSFEIDAGIKHRLVNGFDDIGMTLAHDDAISAYERDRATPTPLTSASA